MQMNYRIAGKSGKFTLFKHLGEKFAKRLLIVSANLNGFSWANHGQFTKLVKLSRQLTIWYSGVRQTMYQGALVLMNITHNSYFISLSKEIARLCS